MERWKRLNVYFGCVGFLLFIVSIIFIKKLPFLLFSAMFGIGMFYKTFKNIYNGVKPPNTKIIKNTYNLEKKKKNRKKKKQK